MKRNLLSILVLIAIVSALAGTPALPAQGAPAVEVDLQLIGQVGGPIRGLAVDRDIAVIGLGKSLAIVNVEKMEVVWRSSPLADPIEAVAVEGDYAYTACGQGGLSVFNLATHALVSSHPIAGFAQDLVVQENIAYVAAGREGVAILDISDPRGILQVGIYKPPDLGYIEVAGVAWQPPSYLHVRGLGMGTHIVDVSDPTDPQKVSGYEPTYIQDGVIEGNRAFAATLGTLYVVDVSDPANPQELGSCSVGSDVLALTVGEGYAYVTTAVNFADQRESNRKPTDTEGGSRRPLRESLQPLVWGMLHVIDVSDPTNPREAVVVDTPWVEEVSEMVVSQETLYVAEVSRLAVWSLNEPANPIPVRSLDSWRQVERLAVGTNLAYVAVGYGGLEVVDLTDPQRPIIIGSWSQSDANVSAVDAREGSVSAGGYKMTQMPPWDPDQAYWSGDISDPTEPNFFEPPLFRFGDYGITTGVGIGKDNLTVASGWWGINYCGEDHCWGAFLSLQDTHNPTKPYEVGRLLLNKTAAENITVAGNGSLVFLAAGGNGVVVIDITNAAAPEVIGSLDTAGHTWDVAVVGDLAYLADDEGGLVIVNVSNPTNPYEVGSCATPGAARAVAVRNKLAFVASRGGGLVVIDVSNPSNPTQLKAVNYGAGEAVDVTLASDNLVLVGDRSVGVLIFEYTITRRTFLPLILRQHPVPTPTPTPTPEPTPAPPEGPLVAFEKIEQVGGNWTETEVVAFDSNQRQTLVKFLQGILAEHWVVGSYGDLGFYVIYRNPNDPKQLILRVGNEETTLRQGNDQISGLSLTVLEETEETVLVWGELATTSGAEVYTSKLQDRQLSQVRSLGPGLSTIPPTINRRGTVAFYRWIGESHLGVVTGRFNDPSSLYTFDSWGCSRSEINSLTTGSSSRSGALALSGRDDLAYFRFCGPPLANKMPISMAPNSLGWLDGETTSQLLISSGTPYGTDSVVSVCGRAGGSYHCYPLGVAGYQPVQVGVSIIAYVSRREENGSWQRPFLYWIFEEREINLDSLGQNMDWNLPTCVPWTPNI